MHDSNGLAGKGAFMVRLVTVGFFVTHSNNRTHNSLHRT